MTKIQRIPVVESDPAEAGLIRRGFSARAEVELVTADLGELEPRVGYLRRGPHERPAAARRAAR